MKNPSDIVLQDADDYEVGYKRPPKNKQFAPGTSGNPKGRPRGRKNMATIFTEIAVQPVTIIEGGRPRTVPRAVAFMLTLWTQAFKGNLKAQMVILHYLRDAGMLQAEPQPIEQPTTDDDQALIADYLKKRIQREAPVQPNGKEPGAARRSQKKV